MGYIKKLGDEGLVDFAERLSQIYNQTQAKNTKKVKGQFFTSKLIAEFMATLSRQNKSDVSILDPGAGTGILTAAVIEKLLHSSNVKNIEFTAYETDPEVIPFLKNVVGETKKYLKKRGVSFESKIIEKDFVLSNADVLTTNLTNFDKPNIKKYDLVISNPPYFKLNKNDLHSIKCNEIISGQPNIYFLFMAISAKLLNRDGEMIFITPRSFCSGLYSSKFRKWLLQTVNFSHIHLFDSRKELFSSENVLQENIITRFVNAKEKNIEVSKSFNGDFSDSSRIRVKQEDVVYRSNGHIFFRIPSNREELRVVRRLDRLPFNFYKLGVKISTGKVVAFRNKEQLKSSIDSKSVPLLWMHNIKKGRIEWPLSKKDKPTAIRNNSETQKKLLLRAGNYVILKRFTTKEQKKRFDTALIYEEDFEEYKYFALDNMTNYIHNPDKSLTKEQTRGISRYLNLPIVELYFRILNGHTQVNANEVYALPFPSMKELEKMGKKVRVSINSEAPLPKSNLIKEICT